MEDLRASKIESKCTWDRNARTKDIIRSMFNVQFIFNEACSRKQDKHNERPLIYINYNIELEIRNII